jgi:hypothetical protein
MMSCKHLCSLVRISPLECVQYLAREVSHIHPLDILYLIRRSSLPSSEAVLAAYIEEFVQHQGER